MRPVNTYEAPGHLPSCWGHRDRLGFQAASPGNPLGLWRGWNPRPQQRQEPRTQHLLSGADGIPGRRATATWPGLGRDPSPPQTPHLCRLVLLSPEAPASCTGPEPPSSEMGRSLPCCQASRHPRRMGPVKWAGRGLQSHPAKAPHDLVAELGPTPRTSVNSLGLCPYQRADAWPCLDRQTDRQLPRPLCAQEARGVGGLPHFPSLAQQQTNPDCHRPAGWLLA